jgi:hypothetical protein
LPALLFGLENRYQSAFFAQQTLPSVFRMLAEPKDTQHRQSPFNLSRFQQDYFVAGERFSRCPKSH